MQSIQLQPRVAYGGLLMQMLNGHPPFQSEDPFEVFVHKCLKCR